MKALTSFLKDTSFVMFRNYNNMDRKGQNLDLPEALFYVIFCHFSVKHISMRYRQIQHGQQNTKPTSISVKTVLNL